ncbi:MAG TPA: hypothetical protein VGY98_09985, partial [Verrucomicrobiae bacterium]|nr:hypothetical protein [Verrucomicrobiae bacterium]
MFRTTIRRKRRLDFRTPLRKAHARVRQAVRDGVQKAFGYVDVLTGARQNEKQIPRRMAAPFVPQGRRDDKFVERRVRGHDVNRARAFLKFDPSMEKPGKSLQVMP